MSEQKDQDASMETAEADAAPSEESQSVDDSGKRAFGAARPLLLFLLAAGFAVVVITIVLVSMDTFTGMAQQFTAEVSGYADGSASSTLLPTVVEEEVEDISLPVISLVAQADKAMASGELQKARDMYEKALELGGDVAVMRKLFDTVLLLGDVKRAESVLGLLSFHGLQDDVLDVMRGLVALRGGKIEQAKKQFSLRPHRSESAYGLSLIAILEEDHDAAKNHLQIVQESADPVLSHAGRVIQGAYDEFELFEDGQSTHLQTLIARSLAQVNRCPIAIELLDSVVNAEADYRDAWIVLGYCRLVLGENDDAHSAFERAYSLDPQKPETQYFLGLSYERAGDLPQAKLFLEFALQNDFEEEIVRQKLAALSEQQQDFPAAVEHYTALLSVLSDDDEQRRLNLYEKVVSLLLDQVNDPDAADDVALEARAEFGDVPQVLGMLGRTSFARGEYGDADSLLSAAVEQDPSLYLVWLARGELNEDAGNTQQAIDDYRQAYQTALGQDSDIVEEAANKHNSLVRMEYSTE